MIAAERLTVARWATQARLISELPGRIHDVKNLRRVGSALELCAVADGSLDCYLEYRPYEHDFAAGALVSQEHGGWVRWPQRSSALNVLAPRSETLAAGTASAVPELAEGFTP